jgi:hypothetical protein
MSNRPKGGRIVALVGLAAVVAAAVTFERDNHFQQNVGNAGYANVSTVYTSIRTPEATTTVHGCEIGFESQNGAGRTVNGHAVTAYTVNLVASGKWTPIVIKGNPAPTPIDLTAYMQQHRTEFPCYKP